MTWEEDVIQYMTSLGWTCDVNDDKRLGFILPVDENYEWIRDYNKETKRFVQFNGKQKVNLVVRKDEPAQ